MRFLDFLIISSLFAITLLKSAVVGQTLTPDCEFQCRNLNCVKASHFRDGENDCGDWTDEDCLPWDYTCPNTGTCVSTADYTTGNYNCSVGIDFCALPTNCSPLANCTNTALYYRCDCPANTTNDISPDPKFPGTICQNLNDNSTGISGSSNTTTDDTFIPFAIKDCNGFRWGKNRRLCVPRSYGIVTILLITFIIAALLIGCCLIAWLLRRVRERRVMDVERPITNNTTIINGRNQVVRPVPAGFDRPARRSRDLESVTSSNSSTMNSQRRHRRDDDINVVPLVVAGKGIRNNKVKPAASTRSVASTSSSEGGTRRQGHPRIIPDHATTNLVNEPTITPVVVRAGSPPLPTIIPVTSDPIIRGVAGVDAPKTAVLVTDDIKSEIHSVPPQVLAVPIIPENGNTVIARHTVVEPSQPIVRKFEIIEDNITESIDRMATDKVNNPATNPFGFPSPDSKGPIEGVVAKDRTVIGGLANTGETVALEGVRKKTWTNY